MTIAIDIDDVIYPFADTLVEYVTKVAAPVTRMELYGDQLYTRSGLSDTEFALHVNTFQNSEESLNIEPLQGAVEAIGILAKQHNLYLITARDASLRGMTEKWISKYFDASVFKELVLVGNHWWGVSTGTKADVCQAIRADYIIEDQPRHIEKFVDHSTIPILFGDYDWNRDFQWSNLKRARSWKDVRTHLGEVSE